MVACSPVLLKKTRVFNRNHRFRQNQGLTAEGAMISLRGFMTNSKLVGGS